MSIGLQMKSKFYRQYPLTTKASNDALYLDTNNDSLKNDMLTISDFVLIINGNKQRYNYTLLLHNT